MSRKIITSARRNEAALDSGPIEGHSLFTGTLVDGLNWGKADLNGDGLVTSSELGLFLQQRVSEVSESKQTPDFGSFHLDDRGEMVISLRDNTFDTVKTRAFIALQQGDMVQFKELVEKVVAILPQSPEALYLQYRLFFSNGNIDDAIEMVHQLRKLDLNKGTVPLTRRDLAELEVQLTFLKPALLIPAGDIPVEITMLTGPDKEHLVEASQELEGGRLEYLIEDGAVVRFKAKNLTQNQAHLYYVAIKPSGRLLIGPLLESDESRFYGLKPGREGSGPPFLVKGVPRLNETHLFYSPNIVSNFLFPSPVMLPPSIENFDNSMIELIKMKKVWYRIVKRKVIT